MFKMKFWICIVANFISVGFVLAEDKLKVGILLPLSGPNWNVSSYATSDQIQNSLEKLGLSNIEPVLLDSHSQEARCTEVVRRLADSDTQALIIGPNCRHVQSTGINIFYERPRVHLGWSLPNQERDGFGYHVGIDLDMIQSSRSFVRSIVNETVPFKGVCTKASQYLGEDKAFYCHRFQNSNGLESLNAALPHGDLNKPYDYMLLSALQVLDSHAAKLKTDQADLNGTNPIKIDVETAIGRFSHENLGLTIETNLYLPFDSPQAGQWNTKYQKLMSQMCPECAGGTKACSKGDKCPKECGNSSCHKEGEYSCCSIAGMPTPPAY